MRNMLAFSLFIWCMLAFAMMAYPRIAFADSDLDWRDRPRMSPYGGFFIQIRAGKQGNFEVVIPWSKGGLAHFWRDNDQPKPEWAGPVLFGDGHYSGASLVEAGFATYQENTMRNFEVLAIG